MSLSVSRACSEYSISMMFSQTSVGICRTGDIECCTSTWGAHSFSMGAADTISTRRGREGSGQGGCSERGVFSLTILAGDTLVIASDPDLTHWYAAMHSIASRAEAAGGRSELDIRRIDVSQAS